MIGWEEARARTIALGVPLAVEEVALRAAAGRWTAAPVVARRTQPACDLSSMDGYAIRFDDLPGPWRVVGEATAGARFGGWVAAGEAVRIFTGAAVPEGADAILVQEDAARDGDRLQLTGDGPVCVGASIRRAGSDFCEDSTLIAAGERLTAARIGLAAAAGHGRLAVRRRVRVALMSTGDELVAAGLAVDQDRLPDANAPMLAALLGDLPVDIVDLGIVADRPEALATAIAAVRDVDVIVTSGGASVGDHDLVRPALIAAGATLDFWRVAMRPGKPLMAGRLGDAVVLGLPGNPVSAFVTASLFLRPLVAHLSGAAAPMPRLLTAQVATAMPAVGIRTDFARARWEGGVLVPIASTDSGALASLAAAEALIVRAAHAPALAAGARVEALLLA